MVYAAVLAGGRGLRMGGGTPKQFLSIDGEPIIVKSVKSFYNNPSVQKIYVSVPADYIDFTNSLLLKYGIYGVSVISGGAFRNESLLFAIKEIDKGNVGSDDIILTHDAVRPFIDDRIINENIEAAKKYGACDTVTEAVDTMLVSSDGKFIDFVPDRNAVYHGQTPQSFNFIKLRDIFYSLKSSELEKYTDVCSVFIDKGEKVSLVKGGRGNVKITYREDLPRFF